MCCDHEQSEGRLDLTRCKYLRLVLGTWSLYNISYLRSRSHYYLLFSSTALSCPLSFTPTYRGCPGSRNRTGRYVPLIYPDLNSVLRACYHLYSYNDRLETFLNPLSFPPLLLYSSTGELVYNLTLKETVFLVFDVLAVEGRACLQLPFSERQRIIRWIVHAATEHILCHAIWRDEKLLTIYVTL